MGGDGVGLERLGLGEGVLGLLFFSFFLFISLSSYAQPSYPAEFVLPLPAELFLASVVLFAAFALWAWVARRFFFGLAHDPVFNRLVACVRRGLSMPRGWLAVVVLVLASYHATVFGVFGEGVVATLDHPMHQYHAYAMKELLLPDQKGVWGWTQHFFAGYPVHQYYPPLVSMLVAGLTGGSKGLLSVPTAYRIVLFAVIVLVPAAMYVLAGEAGLPRRGQTLVALLSAMPSSRFAEMLFWGTTPMLLALGLAPLALAFFLRFLRTGTWRAFAGFVLAGALVLLAHPVIHVGMVVGVVALVVGWRMPATKKMAIGLSAVALPIVATGFWSVPAIAGVLAGDAHVHDTGLTFHSYSTLIGFVNWQVNLLAALPLAAWPVLAWGYWRLAESGRRTDPVRRSLYGFPLLLYAVAFAGGGIPQLWHFELLHLVPLVALALLVPLGEALIAGLERGGLVRVAALFSLAAVLLCPPLGSLVLADTHGASQESSTVLRAGLPENVSTVYAWLYDHADGTSRVVLEDVEHPFFVKKPWGQGAMPALAPMDAGDELRFVARTQAFPVFRGAGNLTVVEGLFFGTPVEEMTYEGMREALHRFNVGYLVLWHGPSKQFFADYRQATLETVIDGFAIYRVPPNPDGYVAGKTPGCPARIPSLGHDRVVVENVTGTCESITVSMAYHPGWQAHQNGTALATERDGLLLRISPPPTPAKGNIVLSFDPHLFR